MNEATRKKVMYGILALAVIWGGWNFTHPRQKRVFEYNSSDEAVVTAESTTTAQAPIDVDAKASEPWGRDPFRSGPAAQSRVRSSGARTTSSATASPTGWKLTGIVDNGTTPLAFINGQMVKVGDEINQARVVKIDKQKVTLSRNGNEFSLQVNKG